VTITDVCFTQKPRAYRYYMYPATCRCNVDFIIRLTASAIIAS